MKLDENSWNPFLEIFIYVLIQCQLTPNFEISKNTKTKKTDTKMKSCTGPKYTSIPRFIKIDTFVLYNSTDEKYPLWFQELFIAAQMTFFID